MLSWDSVHLASQGKSQSGLLSVIYGGGKSFGKVNKVGEKLNHLKATTTLCKKNNGSSCSRSQGIVFKCSDKERMMFSLSLKETKRSLYVLFNMILNKCFSLLTAPTDSDGPLYLPYKTLVSTLRSTVFNEGEAHCLIEILSEKAGIVQDTWHKATQKGDPVAVLKRQLEEKEKLLATEQQDAAAAKNRLRELNKELASEKSKAAAGEANVKKQLLAREQEIMAVQARMKASYRDHVNEVQQLQGKIRSLQEQLENGPNMQLARLQQENSILRDALNQATSQTESKQNAELAKLRQECSKLTKEVAEKSEAVQQEEQQKKSLEKQVHQLQVSQKEKEDALQKRLDEVSGELRKSQSSYKNLLADLEKAKGDQQNIAELHSKLQSSETEVKSKSEELNKLKGKLLESSTENARLTERIKSIEALLEAGQAKEAKDTQASQAEVEQLQARLKEHEAQVTSLEKEATELKAAVEQQKLKNNDLREKNWRAMEALASAEKGCEEKLSSLTKAKEEVEKQVSSTQTKTKETLLSLFPDISITTQQFVANMQSILPGFLQDLASKLKEAEEAQSTLQSECDQYRTILAETEGMLKDLQKSVEEEEQVWKAKLTVSEEELQKVSAAKVALAPLLSSCLPPILFPAPRIGNQRKANWDKGELGVRLKTQLEHTETLLEKEQIQLQKLTAEFEEAQNSACNLQAELEKLRASTSMESSETEEAVQLKERLEKEKKLTKGLGQAATKLQGLLKISQEQLTKEKEMVKKLQEKLEKTEDAGSAKEGTSV
uniref:Ribosome-binding protein 1 n=1 Tax=Vombatus ursinus TaxID=29139 RepID=A0A4X2KAW5_VOMUR